MIARKTAADAIDLLSSAIAEMTEDWADVEIAGDGDLQAAAVAARLVGSALSDVGVLASAVQVLVRWAEPRD